IEQYGFADRKTCVGVSSDAPDDVFGGIGEIGNTPFWRKADRVRDRYVAEKLAQFALAVPIDRACSLLVFLAHRANPEGTGGMHTGVIGAGRRIGRLDRLMHGGVAGLTVSD